MKRYSILFLTLLSSFGLSQIEPDRVFPRLVTHVPKFENGFKATIFLRNDSSLSKEVYFNSFNEHGEILNLGDPVRYRIPGLSTLTLDGSTVLPESTSHFTIIGSTRVGVSLMYGSGVELDNGRALLHESKEAGHRFAIFPTGANPEEGYWEGLALVNLGTHRATITFRLLDMFGHELASNDIGLNGMAKHTSVLSGLFEENFVGQSVQIEVLSDQPISLVMLTGNSNHKDISNIAPEPLVQLEPLLLTDDITSLPKKILGIENIQFEEELLHVSALLPNPCHDLELFWNGGIKESFPPQVDIYLVGRDVSDVCFQPITQKTRTFDLTKLSEAFADSGGSKGDTLIVNLRDENHDKIIFVYNFVPFQ